MTEVATGISEQARTLPRADQLPILVSIADALGFDELNEHLGDIVAHERAQELREGTVQPMTREEVFAAIHDARQR